MWGDSPAGRPAGAEASCEGDCVMRLPSVLAALTMAAASMISLAGSADAAETIVCDNTADTALTGTLDGTVVVPEGANCFIVDATITGAFRAIHSPGVVSLIDTHVLAKGGIFVKGAMRRVTIGSDGCRVDPYAGRNLKVFDSRNVAICEMGIRNNLMVKRSTGRVMVRDNYACNNLMVTDNIVLGLRVFDNRYTRNLMIERNTVENKTDVRDNVDTGESVNECRASILEENGF
jgi:hypothetical protein